MNELIRKWTPTRAQYKAYADREVELCRAAIKRIPRLAHADTLYSLRTWLLANA